MSKNTRTPRCRYSLFALLSLQTGLLFAHEDHTASLEEVVVYGRAEAQIGTALSASEGLISADEIRLPPLLRTGELAEAVPGMVATSHSGTGKANQFFLRGFNLDHGTDFAAEADGVPLNLPTHGHGQGYLDLNFLIPELVERTRYQKGPASADLGDFSAAGNVRFELYDRLPESRAAVTLGEFGYQRAFAGTSVSLKQDHTLTAAGTFERYDGPWVQSEDLRAHKLHLAYAGTLGDARTKLTYQDYQSEWTATDQIPLRAVQDGRLDRLGFVDPDLGGDTRRRALSASLETDRWSLLAYGIDYDFTLFSNFTYQLDNPERGDEFEQEDQRRVYGLKVDRLADWAGVQWHWGAAARFDQIDALGLFRTESRQRFATLRDDQVDLWALGAFIEGERQFGERLRASASLRLDHQRFDVDAVRDANDGSGNDHQLSPKISLAYRLADSVELYGSAGRGMHSNDARGSATRIDPASGEAVDTTPLLVAAHGREFGMRFEPTANFNATLAVFRLRLESELLFVGDAGTTEPNAGSTRQGVELAGFWQPLPWLALNTAYTQTRARFDGVGRDDHIPGAIEDTLTAGVIMSFQNGLQASLRLRHLGPAPLREDNRVRAPSSTLVNGVIGYTRGPLEARLELFNLLDSEDFDIAYLFASRLEGEAEEGIEDIHFHPLEPRAVRFSMAYRW